MTARKDFNLAAYTGGKTLSYEWDFWDTLRQAWADMSKMDMSSWQNPPVGSRRVIFPASGQIQIQENQGTAGTPNWVDVFNFNTATNAAAIASAATTAGNALPKAGGTMSGQLVSNIIATGKTLSNATYADAPLVVGGVTGNDPSAASFMAFTRPNQNNFLLGFDADNELKINNGAVRTVCHTGLQRFFGYKFSSAIGQAFAAPFAPSSFTVNDGQGATSGANAGRYTVNRYGLYQVCVTGNVFFVPTSSGSPTTQINIARNGSWGLGWADLTTTLVAGVNQSRAVSFKKMVLMSPGDYIEVGGYTSSTSGANANLDISIVNFSVP